MFDLITALIIIVTFFACGLAVTIAIIYGIIHIIQTLRQGKICAMASALGSNEKIIKKKAFPKVFFSAISMFAAISIIELLLIFAPSGIKNCGMSESISIFISCLIIFACIFSGIFMLIKAYRESERNCIISRSTLPPKYNMKIPVLIRIVYCALLLGLTLVVIYYTALAVGLQWIFVVLYFA